MSGLTFILAAIWTGQFDTASGGGPLIAGSDPLIAAIFFIIWAVIFVFSAYQKLNEARKKRPQRIPPPPVAAPTRPGQMQTPQRPQRGRATLRQPARPQTAPQQPQRPQRPPGRPKFIQPPPLPAAPPAASPAPSTRQAIEATEIESESRPRQPLPAVSAAQLARGLRPENFRKLYILTELLQPPVGLRGEERI